MSYEDQIPGSTSFEFDDCPHNRLFWDEWVMMDEIQRLTMLFKYKDKPYHKFWDGHNKSKDAKAILEEHIGRMHVRDIALDAPHTTSYFPVSLTYRQDTVKAHLSDPSFDPVSLTYRQDTADPSFDPDGKQPARDPNLTFAASMNLPSQLLKKKKTVTGTGKKTSTTLTQSLSMKRSPADNVEERPHKCPRPNKDDPPMTPESAITNLTRIPELTVPTSCDSTPAKSHYSVNPHDVDPFYNLRPKLNAYNKLHPNSPLRLKGDVPVSKITDYFHPV